LARKEGIGVGLVEVATWVSEGWVVNGLSLGLREGLRLERGEPLV